MKKSILLLALIVLGLTAQNSFAGFGSGPTVPDGGTTALLLAVAVGGLGWCSKRLRR